MNIVLFPLKIIAAPLYVAFAILAALGNFICGISAGIFWVLSGILVLTSFITFWGVDAWNWSDYYFRSAVFQLVFAFAVSPYGLPKLLELFVGLLENIKDGLRSFMAY